MRRCSVCKGYNIQVMAWVDANTYEWSRGEEDIFTSYYDAAKNAESYCSDCYDNTEIEEEDDQEPDPESHGFFNRDNGTLYPSFIISLTRAAAREIVNVKAGQLAWNPASTKNDRRVTGPCRILYEQFADGSVAASVL